MLIIPAVDIKDGKCVRLLQGQKDQETIYSNDPVDVALKWQKNGAEYLHVVDLDGAFEGSLRNLKTVRKILERISIPVELGGGIRNLGTIGKLLSLGINRVIIGTVAVSDPTLVKKAINRWGPDRILVSIDAKDGKVALKGWVELSEIDAVDFALQMKELGIQKVIFTDVSVDGTLVGPNITSIENLAKKTGLSVIAAGGISSLNDIVNLTKLQKYGVEGAILGKALYEGKVNLEDAIKVATQQQ